MAVIDLGEFEERAAILEYDRGMSRFDAETKAAALMGCARWEAINEIKRRDSEQARHQRSTPRGRPAHDVPRVQPASAKEA